MIIALLFWTLSCFPQETVPFLSADEYSYEIDYFLKQKDKDRNTIYDVKENTSESDMMPFVRINFKFPHFGEDDHKIRVFQGTKNIQTVKIKGPTEVKLDMGFSADLKEKTVPAEFILYIQTKEKDYRGRIKIEVKPNGELLINNVPSGMI